MLAGVRSCAIARCSTRWRISVSGLAGGGAGWVAESNQAGANFGRAVGTAGDVNGDGYDDVIVGAWHYDNGETDEGRAYIYHGSSTGLSETAAWTAEGDQAGALFGFSAGTAGDVNGDGYHDVIVGAHAYDSGATDEGRAYVFYGDPEHDCDDSSPHCTTDCTTDSDDDGTRDCSDTCVDVDGDGYGSTGGPTPTTCPGADCDDGNVHCTSDCTDGDTDGYCDAHDCDAADGQLWSVPGEAVDLTFSSDHETLAWLAPAENGATSSPLYDTIRASTASDFATGYACVESDDGGDTQATDAGAPAAGSAWFYLVRAENGCGHGPAGWDSGGTERTAAGCP